MPKANKIPPLQEIEPKPSVRYVARFRGDCADGWRYQRSTKEGGTELAVYFLASEYGDLVSALAAAEAFSIAQNQGAMKRHARSWDSRSQFAFCGVSLPRNSKFSRAPCYYWVANWSETDAGLCRRRFSILEYGYAGAFLNAAYERIRAVGVQPNLNPHEPPEPPEEVAAWMRVRGIDL